MAAKLVAFDIGESLMKMVCFSGKKITKAVCVELPENLVSRGEIVSMDAMGDFIRQMAKEHGIRRTNAAIVLPSSLVIARTTSVPAMNEKQLAFNLPYEFRNYLTEEKEKYFYDYAFLSHSVNDANEPVEMRLFACATLKKTIGEYREMFRRAGFKLKRAIPEEWAYRVLMSGYLQNKEDAAQDYGIVDFGYGGTRLQIIHEGEPETKRSANIGLEDLERQVAEENDVDIHIAHSYVMKDFNDVLSAPSSIELYHRIAVEILKAVNFYNYNSGGAALHDLFLCGGGAAIGGLCDAVRETTGLNVMPLEELLPAVDKMDEPWLFASAIGCGMRD